MAVDITVGFPGVDVLDQTVATNIVSPYGVAIILGSANEGAIQELTIIASLEDFEAEFGTDSPSGKYINSFFTNLIDQNVRLYFYRVNGETEGNPDSPVSADYVTALDNIDSSFNPGGIVIAPEAFETFTTIQRQSIVAAMLAFCNYDTNKSLWLGIADLTPSNTSITDAVTDKAATISAAKGQIWTYAPHYYNGETVPVLLLPSAAMSAITLSLWTSGRYYEVPAGSSYPIRDFVTPGYIVRQNQRNTAHTNNINLIRNFSNIGYAPDDAITVSPSKEFYHINSVVCFRIVLYMLQIAMEPYIHREIAGTTELLTQAQAGVIRTLQSALDSGYLVRRAGRPISDAYTVKLAIENLPDPGNSVAVIECAIRPSYALQKIVVYVTNTLGTITNI